MSQRLTIDYQGAPCYDILFTDSFDALPGELERLGLAGKKACIVTDSNVGPLYLDAVKSAVESVCEVTSFEIPAGEEHKNLDEIRRLYAHLIESHLDRKSFLIALGGGVIGDMTGFAAATYLRGIDYIQIPTTLLSLTDSSIGGKTGVDFDGYKNMVGAFKMPRLVYSNLSALKTLDGKQYASGFAEVMKHGLIRDEDFYVWLIDHIYEIGDRDMETLQELLLRSCSVKKNVVESDPLEKGERAILNFGHTLGHAIEKYKNFELLHGECVALGCVAASFISWKREMISKEDYYEIRDMFVPFGLPISTTELENEQIIALTASDKKVGEGTLRFILLNGIGNAVIVNDVTAEEMSEALDEINFDKKDY
ncbi:MAG: 3-dehydroquinate synthase [Lachnospiraceae bacterium]|nr:3-dehydroquinate synthase [Lachnospiraceae bacterium]